MGNRSSAAALLLLLLPAALAAQAEPRRVLTAVRVDVSPTVDGRLDDSAWSAAEPHTGFVQVEPEPGAAASEDTEVRVLFDGTAVYVGLRMWESHRNLLYRRVTRRDDASTTTDRVTVYLAGFNDGRTAAAFTTTPAGARADAQWFEDNRSDAAWDGVWDVATRTDAEGWTAEFRIPLSQLRYSTSGDGAGIWGVQVRRDLAHANEVSYWSPVPPNAGRTVSLFGELHGLNGLRTPMQLEVAPYLVARMTREPGDVRDPFFSSTAMGADAGADIRVGITSNLILTSTINPDFGQVEADPSVVNLSAFETSYPERRPFFTEGADAFRFPTIIPEGNIFYSRRIGRPPQRPGSRPPQGYVDNPQTTRVLGATKLTGRTPSGWSVGVMSALTAHEQATVSDSLLARTSVTAEPLTHYGVARVSRNLRQGASGVGAIFTATHRRLDEDPRLAVLRSSAYTVGMDARHRFTPEHEIAGWLVGSSIHGDTAAIAAAQRGSVHRFRRPDAEHLEYDPALTSMQGWAGEFAVRRIGGEGITWSVMGGTRSPGLDINEVGFQTYADIWYLYGSIGYRRTRPGTHLRNWNVSVNSAPAWSFGMEPNQYETNFNAAAQFRSGWGLNGFLRLNPAALSPSDLRGGPALRFDTNTELMLRTTSDARRQVSGSMQGNIRYTPESDSRFLSLQASVTANPTSQLSVSLAPRTTWNRSADQYVRTVSVGGQPRYIVGGLDQVTAVLTARVAYVVTPTLSVDVYLQPFLSGGDYTVLRQVQEPRATDFDRRFDTFTDARIRHDAPGRRYLIDDDADGRVDFTIPDPDFSTREFRSNTVLRWEYRPGSTLYLVWAQSRSNPEVARTLDLDRDLDRLFSARATNVVMLKASYWLSR